MKHDTVPKTVAVYIVCNEDVCPVISDHFLAFHSKWSNDKEWVRHCTCILDLDNSNPEAVQYARTLNVYIYNSIEELEKWYA